MPGKVSSPPIEQPGIISCAGATPIASMVVAFKEGKTLDSVMPILTKSKTILNGILSTPDQADQLSRLVQISPLPDDSELALKVPSGYINGGLSSRFTNISDQPIRLRIDMTDSNENSDVILLLPSDNLTYVQNDPRIIDVCLSPVNSNDTQISCAGATPYIYFDSLRDFWSIEVNGKFTLADSTPLKQLLEFGYPGQFSVGEGTDGEEWLSIRNLSDQPQRIKLIPNVPGTLYSDPASRQNGSFGMNPDGSVYFCLSPYEPQ